MIDRKEQILDTATELLQTRSFTSFSYQDLSDRLGITKASIHHHFPSKDDLGVALAARYYVLSKAALEAIADQYKKPWDRFEAYIAMMGQIIHSGEKICASCVIQAEYNVVPEGMRREASRLCEFIVGWLAAVLAEGREQGVMTFPGTPQDQALMIHTAVQGALQLARAEGPKRFTAVARQLKAALKQKN